MGQFMGLSSQHQDTKEAKRAQAVNHLASIFEEELDVVIYKEKLERMLRTRWNALSNYAHLFHENQ